MSNHSYVTQHGWFPLDICRHFDVKRLFCYTTHTSLLPRLLFGSLKIYLDWTLDPDKERKQAGGNSTKHSSSPLACQPPTGILGQKRAGHVSACELARLAREPQLPPQKHSPQSPLLLPVPAEAGRFASLALTT